MPRVTHTISTDVAEFTESDVDSSADRRAGRLSA